MSAFSKATRLCALMLLVAGLAETMTLAQQPPGGPPPGFAPGPPPFGGPPMMFRPMTAVSAPLPLLRTELNLSSEQQGKIGVIQGRARRQIRSMMPRPGDGGPPNFDAMRTAMEKERAVDREASEKIAGVLNQDQKRALPVLLKDASAFRMAGLPLKPFGDLRLSTDQKEKIAAIEFPRPRAGGPPVVFGGPGGGPPPGGFSGGPPPPAGFGGPGGFRGGPPPGFGPMGHIRKQVMDVLTEQQRNILKQYESTHPAGPAQFGRGRGPGFGPPPGPPPADPQSPPPGE